MSSLHSQLTLPQSLATAGELAVPWLKGRRLRAPQGGKSAGGHQTHTTAAAPTWRPVAGSRTDCGGTAFPAVSAAGPGADPPDSPAHAAPEDLSTLPPAKPPRRLLCRPSKNSSRRFPDPPRTPGRPRPSGEPAILPAALAGSLNGLKPLAAKEPYRQRQPAEGCVRPENTAPPRRPHGAVERGIKACTTSALYEHRSARRFSASPNRARSATSRDGLGPWPFQNASTCWYSAGGTTV